jgi:hypothetical protein
MEDIDIEICLCRPVIRILAYCASRAAHDGTIPCHASEVDLRNNIRNISLSVTAILTLWVAVTVLAKVSVMSIYSVSTMLIGEECSESLQYDWLIPFVNYAASYGVAESYSHPCSSVVRRNRVP